MFQERIYRNEIGVKLDYFSISIEETDLWIGISKGFINDSLKNELKEYLINERKKLKDYNILDPQFNLSLVPYKALKNPPDFVNRMSNLSFYANVGPMAGVAGAFSLLVGNFLKDKKIPEIIVENGGDIFLYGMKSLTVGVYAGKSVFSNKISLEIDVDKKNLGVCSSSGSFGHSLSFGKADLVTIIAEDVILADLMATSICNKIQSKDNIDKIINDLQNIKEISGALIIMEDKLGLFGKLKIKERN